MCPCTMGEDGTERGAPAFKAMASTASEEFRQAARECLHLAQETTEPEIKASYEDLAGSYQHLADKTTVWAAGIETERAILDAAKFSLAAQKAAVSPSEQAHVRLWHQQSSSANNDLDRREIARTW
jgi:hypothetical protein